MRFSLWTLALIAFIVAPTSADERLKGVACRSVHLGYPAPEGRAFYTEMAVENSAPGTFFMAAGWSTGYFGLQELVGGKKVVLFSVWDPTAGDDPKTVDETKRVKLLHNDRAVRIERFGGEGTGGQSFFDYDWKAGQTYRFLVTAMSDGDARTAYGGYFFVPEKNGWKHLVTFSTITDGTLIRGYYSFVEDFRRDRTSATEERRATFGNGWVLPAKGRWAALDRARFTADANPSPNIDAGVSAGRFFLATGGDIENRTTKLRDTIIRDMGTPAAEPPADLPKFE